MHYAFVIDVRRCIGCKACTVACKAQWDVPIGLSRNWVLDTGVQGTFPNLQQVFITGNCMHCDEPPCVEVCPNGSTYKRDDGIVMIDQDACLGCGQCISACPYDARFYNPEKGVVDKCDTCLARREHGEEPACVATCIGGARMFGDLDDPTSTVSKALAENKGHITKLVTPELDTGPNIYYIGLEDVPAGLLPLPHQPYLTSAGTTWKNVVVPVIGFAVGAAFLGQGAAYALQLLKGEEDVTDY